MRDKGDVESTSFVRTIDCDGSTLSIKQLYVGTVGCVVWDAALVLCRFLENRAHFGSAYWAGKRVLELGSGTGAVGLAAAVLGADVLLTDLPEIVPLMKENICINSATLRGHAEAMALVWGHDVLPGVKPDVVLMADTIYHEEFVCDLVKTLVEVTSHHSLVVMAFERRTTGNKPEIERRFFEMMQMDFSASAVPLEDLDEEYQCDEISVIMWRRRDAELNGHLVNKPLENNGENGDVRDEEQDV